MKDPLWMTSLTDGGLVSLTRLRLSHDYSLVQLGHLSSFYKHAREKKYWCASWDKSMVLTYFKGLVEKMKIKSLITYPHAVPTP